MTKRDRLKVRWNAITTDVERSVDREGNLEFSITNSKRMARLTDTLEELGARLIEETHNDEELAALESAVTDSLMDIERRLLDFAEGVEASRDERRAAAA